MQENFLKVGTIVMGIAVVLLLGWQFSERVINAFAPTAIEDSSSDGAEGTGAADSDAMTDPAAISGDDPALDADVGTKESDLIEDADNAATDSDTSLTSSTSSRPADMQLRIGTIRSVPSRDEVLRIDALPSTANEMMRLYRDSRERSCRLLTADTPVAPPLSFPRTGQTGRLGRSNVFTVGLMFDNSGTKLPKLTQQKIREYFDQHRMVIQPMIYHDEQGRPYFGPEVNAAFFAIDQPRLTKQPEPLIRSAVQRFRVFGVVGNGPEEEGSSNTANADLGRTLALSFTFDSKESTLTSLGKRRRKSMELLLLHLPPDATADRPKIEVYITSEERMTLHRVIAGSMEINGPAADLSANVRFEDTSLMGMYPDKPTVTSIRYRSKGILSMQTVLSQTTSEDRVLSVTQLLDQFSRLAPSGD